MSSISPKKIIYQCCLDGLIICSMLVAIIIIIEVFKKGFIVYYVETNILLMIIFLFGCGVMYFRPLFSDQEKKSYIPMFLIYFFIASGFGLLAYQYGMIFGRYRLFFAGIIFLFVSLAMISLNSVADKETL